MANSWIQNRIPARPIEERVNKYLDLTGISVRTLANEAGVDNDVLEKIACGSRQSVDFDVADRLLCAMGILMENIPELAELYWSIDLSRQFTEPVPHDRFTQCAAPGCGERFERRHGGSGGHNTQVYCSDRCRERAIKMRNGKQRTEDDSRRYVCRHGHERTPESTEHLKNGTRRCKICNRQRTQEFRARQRAALAVA